MIVLAKWGFLQVKVISDKYLPSRRAVFKNTSRGTEVPTLSLLGNLRCYIYILAKLGHPAVLALFTETKKVNF